MKTKLAVPVIAALALFSVMPGKAQAGDRSSFGFSLGLGYSSGGSYYYGGGGYRSGYSSHRYHNHGYHGHGYHSTRYYAPRYYAPRPVYRETYYYRPSPRYYVDSYEYSYRPAYRNYNSYNDGYCD